MGKKLGSCSLVDIFWSKVDRRGPDECWPWKACVVRRYGQLTYKNKRYRSNRLAWFLTTGKEAGSLLMCHTCDNTLCVNPKHLFLGTDKDNQEDCARKGRKLSKLNPAIVVILRCECIPGNSEFGYSALARKYGVNPGAIWQAVNGTRWKHVKTFV